MSPAEHATIYFGYGSNLWREQMERRCPTSKFLGTARLKGYKWIIYDRGYANIVQLPDASVSAQDEEQHDYSQEVWGLVYSLQPSDEARLDGNEGVPYAYQKETIECEFWPAESDEKTMENVGKITPKKVPMLVYINRTSTKESHSKEEYVYRMNMGIKDGVKEGVPQEYVRQVLRKFIPDVEDQRVERVARQQALEFQDET